MAWGPWCTARIGDDGFSILTPSGEPRKAHAVRRPGGVDFLRVSEHSQLPMCRSGRTCARPNVLLFGDGCFNTSRVYEQRKTFEAWCESLPRDVRLAIVEVGAGRYIPVARDESEKAARDFPRSTLIRINLDDCSIGNNLSARAVSIGGIGALEALTRIDVLLQQKRRARSQSETRLSCCHGLKSQCPLM
eukprot:TRINITY_DN74117_c0_g1_i1.p1 TRINITY_DN74117_c0_g1~~TRINITY_DN74117_c0_g1_i1.p1  ORF type:complete len:209 (-),score=11.60 TRINITY_DN74117_c0_g1_i1:378-947(-)